MEPSWSSVAATGGNSRNCAAAETAGNPPKPLPSVAIGCREERRVRRGRRFDSPEGFEKSPANRLRVLSAMARFRFFAGTRQVLLGTWQLPGTRGQRTQLEASESACKPEFGVAHAGALIPSFDAFVRTSLLLVERTVGLEPGMEPALRSRTSGAERLSETDAPHLLRNVVPGDPDTVHPRCRCEPRCRL